MPTEEYELIEPEDRNLLLGILQLMRLPNIFTAMADVAMGFLFVKGDADLADWWVLGLLLGASSMLYVGGVVLNDVVDRELDAVERPHRPLPSGRVTLTAACIFSGILLLAGIALGWTAALAVGKLLPGIVASLLLACILIYNGLLKTTLLGPPTMGGCRMLNVLLGMSVAGGSFAAENWLVAGGIGLYIAGVTWFARTEAERSKRRSTVFNYPWNVGNRFNMNGWNGTGGLLPKLLPGLGGMPLFAPPIAFHYSPGKWSPPRAAKP